jgi:octaprenyl-diphosphate synthase
MLQFITKPVQKELDAFDKLYTNILHVPISEFQYMLNFILKKKGKRIRPIILILSAKLCGEPTVKTIEYAVILELLHVATLIHDDVVDNAVLRRGNPSVMAKFGNQAAVLLGDYILSKAIKQGIETKNFAILQVLTHLAQNLCEGELTQLIFSSKKIIDENHYFEIIRKKTAILFSVCSKIGALSVNADVKKNKTLQLIGEYLGICFQIRDDLLDYLDSEKIGKPTKNDIKEGKITLPLIYALKTAPKAKSKPMMLIIKKQDFSSENVQQLINFTKEQKGIEYAQEKMLKIKTNIIELLNYFPHSEAKKSMLRLIDYIIERKK